MLYTIDINKITIGMYVVLPQNWLDHSFLYTSFLIKSESEIKKLQKSGLKEIQFDSSRSQAALDIQSITHPAQGIDIPEEWKPDTNMSQELRNIINNPSMPPPQKALAVYQNSQKIIEGVFANPSAEAITDFKDVVSDIADLILSDEETSANMLRITSHDFYTYTHSVNVGILSIFLAKRLYSRNSDHNIHELGAGFFLHDLGKIKVDPQIINKPARLTEHEMQRMRTHPYQSFKTLDAAGQLSEECRVICMQHHEREDGTGYPKRLAGNEIHDYARICSIADVYDALTSERSYKKALTPFQALQVMKDEMLGFFHKEIFENFVHLLQTK
nr:HD-GYP domain-containing protein [Desulfobulbaceae bacterium]